MVYETYRLTWTLMWPCIQILQAIVCIINYPSSALPEDHLMIYVMIVIKSHLSFIVCAKLSCFSDKEKLSLDRRGEHNTYLLTFVLCMQSGCQLGEFKEIISSVICVDTNVWAGILNKKRKHFYILISYFFSSVLFHTLHNSIQNIYGMFSSGLIFLVERRETLKATQTLND